MDNDDCSRTVSSFYKYDKHHKFSHELWTKMYKSKTTGSKALFIDDDTDSTTLRTNGTPSKWSELPNLLLEQIFSYLSIRERYYASLVCRTWNQAFYLPAVWSHFVLEDTTLTRGRFNYYSGWQYVLDHVRTQMCLAQIGRNIRHLTFEPMLNFFNLYEFMNMISWCRGQYSKAPRPEWATGRNIRTVRFTFPCSMTTENRPDQEQRIRLFGTGGKLLEALKNLLGNLPHLRHLELIDLMLDQKEAQYLLDDVVLNCLQTLRILHLVNTTNTPYPILHCGVFLNLKVLVVSPQNLGDDAIELLSHTNLEHLHLVQNRYTPNDINIKPVTVKMWYQMRRTNPLLKVHLQLQTFKAKPLIWQEGAPVATILYDSPHIGVDIRSVITATDFYSSTLTVYGHQNLPKRYSSKSFHDRADSSLLQIVQKCHLITTLIVTERISTATVLLLAYSAPNLRRFYVRRNAVILRSDWPRLPQWTDEFYKWFKQCAHSYSTVEEQVSKILTVKNWHMLTDQQFKRLEIDLHS